MGVIEEEGSKIRRIYGGLRSTWTKASKLDGSLKVIYVDDPSWEGESLFAYFYKYFLDDNKHKELVCTKLMDGKLVPKYGRWKGKMTRALAIALLTKVSQLLL